MYQEERLKELLAIIEAKRIVSVEELKSQLYVSTSTVRRDLAELSRRGLVVRSSGGAIAMSERETNDSMLLEKPTLEKPGSPIGVCAAAMVQNGECIFLGVSAATQAMVPYLAQKRGLTVVTDSPEVVTALCGSGVMVYCCSGRYAERSNSFGGALAGQFLSHFNFDAAYFTCDALTSDGRMSFHDLEVLALLQQVQANAKKRILLCGRAKIGVSCVYNVSDLRRIDAVVTDAPELLRGLPCEVGAAVG